MSGLPPRPKPAGYVATCTACEKRRSESAIACADHRTTAEWSWFHDVEAISAAPSLALPHPTLF